MRSIWRGSIGFGLVNIPVRLYSATQQSRLDLDMVDVRDLENIQYKRVNESTGKEVDWDQIGKAYKLNDKYILLDDEDFEKASPEKTKTVHIDHFVNESEIDTIYFENAYFIEPEKSGERAYQLLLEALKKSKKVGVSQFVMRTVETLAVIKVMGDILILNKIRFAQEIRSYDELKIPSSKIKPAEMKMAMDLIDQYSSKFDIEKFRDEYAESLLKIIKAKAKKPSSKKTTTKKMKVVHKKSDNLLDQLKASLKKSS